MGKINKLFSLIIHAKNNQNHHKTWHLCLHFNSSMFNMFLTEKSMKTYTISKSTAYDNNSKYSKNITKLVKQL